MKPLSLDTSLDIERRQIEGWQRMTPADKAAMVSGLTKAAIAMTRAGIRQRHPTASPREVLLRTAIITLGPDLAAAAYPDARSLISAP